MYLNVRLHDEAMLCAEMWWMKLLRWLSSVLVIKISGRPCLAATLDSAVYDV